jgi:hypothetical protein
MPKLEQPKYVGRVSAVMERRSSTDVFHAVGWFGPEPMKEITN